MTKSCSSLKAELKRLAKQCSIDPLNTLIRQKFKITKRKYKKLLKKKELQHVHTNRDKLIDTLNKDPQSFWNSIKELRKDQCDQDGNNSIELDTWFDYFKALYSNKNQIDGNLEIFDDVSDIFNDASDPVPFETDKHLSHLAFADDLALFSLSKAGLQRCLDNLSNYCKKWGLEVGIKKKQKL